ELQALLAMFNRSSEGVCLLHEGFLHLHGWKRYFERLYLDEMQIGNASTLDGSISLILDDGTGKQLPEEQGIDDRLVRFNQCNAHIQAEGTSHIDQRRPSVCRSNLGIEDVHELWLAAPGEGVKILFRNKPAIVELQRSSGNVLDRDEGHTVLDVYRSF